MKLEDKTEMPAHTDLELQPVSQHAKGNASNGPRYDGGFSLLDQKGEKLSKVEKTIRVARKRNNFQEFTCG